MAEQHKVTFMENEYKNEKTGESARGVTVILNGKFGEMIDQIRSSDPQKYQNNIAVIQEALFRGLNSMLKDGSELTDAAPVSPADGQ